MCIQLINQSQTLRSTSACMYFEKKLTKEVNDIPPYSRMTLKCLSFCRFYTHKALKQTLNIIHNKRQYFQFKYMYKVMGYQLMISGLTVHDICAINTGERADNMQPFYVSTYLNGQLVHQPTFISLKFCKMLPNFDSFREVRNMLMGADIFLCDV